MADARAKYEITAQDKTKRATKSATKGFGLMQASVAAVGVAAVANLAGKVVNAAKRAAAVVTDSAKSMDDLAKSANRLGIGVQTLDSLNFAAQLAGASGKDLETIYKRGARSIVDAADGIGEGKKALDRLGISATDSGGNVKGIEQIILEFSDALPRLKSETELTATAMGLFGRSGQQIIPLLRQGSEAIHDQLIEARVLGARTADLTRKGEDFVDAQLRLNRAMRASKDVITGAVLPSLSTLAETLAEKVVGLVTGLTREFRTFLATAQLEGPDVQIKLLNERLEESRRKVPQLKGELDGLLETVASGRMEVADVADDELRTVTTVRKEYENEKREVEAILKALEQAKKDRQAAIDNAQRIRQIREEERKAEEKAAEAQLRRSENLVREKILREDINTALREQLELVEELPENIELELPPPPGSEQLVEGLTRAEEAARDVGISISDDMGRSLGQFITTGKTGAGIFRSAWTSAINDVAGQLIALGLKAGLNSLFPGLGFLGGLFGLQAGGPQAEALTAGLPTGNLAAGPIIIQRFESLTPANTDDYNRANVAAQEAQTRANRFLIRGGS